MAPALAETAPLAKRALCQDQFGYTYRCYSSWDNWGRWVALAVIVIGVLLIAFLFSCISARRRRKRGIAPMYGTGWVPYGANKNQYNPNNTGYYNNQPYNGAPAPPYSGPMPNQQTGTTFNSNDGYYGHHGQGVEMQPPQNTYQPRGGENVYEAPVGPPPGKGDGVIR